MEVLKDGRVRVRDIEAEARGAGLLGDDKQMRQSKPFRSAKDDLDIISTKEGFGSDAIYYWQLPPGCPGHHTRPPQKQGAYGKRGRT